MEEIGRVPVAVKKAYLSKNAEVDNLLQGGGSGQWDSEIKAFMENITLKSLFFNEDWVFIVVDVVADHISMSPLKVKKFKTVKGKKIVENNDDHPLNSVFEEPNSFQDGQSYMYQYAVELLLMGNSINWYSKDKNLMVIPAETVLLDFDTAGKLSNYMMADLGESFVGTHIREGMSFPVDQIIHQRRPNPNSILWGLSPFIPNRKSLLFNRYTQDYMNSFYLKGATPGLALKMDKNVSEESAMRFLRSFETSQTGRRNQRRTMILPKGVGLEVITPSMGDQRITDMTKLNQTKILNILRVPKHAMSMAEEGSLGSEEHKQALKFFYSSAIIPNQQKIAKTLTIYFRKIGELKEDEFLEFDNSNIEVLKEDMIKKADLGLKLSGQWTLNEIRENVWNMESMEGGDALPSVVSVGNQLMPRVGDDSGDGKKPEDKPEEDGNEDNEVDEEEEKMLAERAVINKALITKYADWIEISKKSIDEEIDKSEDSLIDVYLDVFVDQAKEVIKVVKKDLAIKTKADDDVPKKVRKKKLAAKLKKALEKSNSKAIKKSSDILKEAPESGFDVQLDLIKEGDQKDAIKALGVKDKKNRSAQLKSRGIKSFSKMNQSTTDKIMKLIESGVKENKSIKEISKDITDNFSKVSPARAAKIARTEVLTAVSIGKASAVKLSGKVIKNLKKSWITQGDGNVRDSHVELQGDVVDYDEPFDNGLQYPRDVKSSDPEEVVNCRCDLLMGTIEDLN